MRTKSSIVTELEILLEDRTTEEFVNLLGNYMNTKELNEFLEFVEEEYD